MELATLAAAAIALRRYRVPFLVMPVAVTLWTMSMDLAPLLLQSGSFFATARSVSLGFGLAMIALAIALDWRRRDERDFAFWLHIFGALTFWGALSLSDSGSEWGMFAYALINVGLVFAGALLDRRVFAVLGGIGLAGYLGHLAYRVFADSMLFPIALTLLGLAIVGLGIVWQRHSMTLGARMRAALPQGLAGSVGRVNRSTPIRPLIIEDGVK